MDKQQLIDIYDKRATYGYVETIKKMFDLCNGKAIIIPYTDYITYKGYIIHNDVTYNIDGLIYDVLLKEGFIELINKLMKAME